MRVTVVEVPVDWTDEVICEINAFENAMKCELDPALALRPMSVTKAHRELRESPMRVLVARNDEGRIVGSAWVEMTTTHNTHLVGADISVARGLRRQGIATQLLGALVALAEADGRTTILLGTDHLAPAAEAFAASLGMTFGMAAHTNQLTIANVDRDRMASWRAATHPDYAIEWITPDGPYPDDALDDMAHLRGVLVNDAPMGDIPLEHRVVTHEQLRADEARLVGYGRTRWTLIARHRSGTPVAYTEVFVDPNDPRHLFQGATAVDPGHRGHALGQQLKATMFERVVAERPEAEFIRTFNADDNRPMLAVNEAMGFEPLYQAIRWVIDTADAKSWVEKRT